MKRNDIMLMMYPEKKINLYNQALEQAINRQSLERKFNEKGEEIGPNTNIGSDILSISNYNSYFGGIKNTSKKTYRNSKNYKKNTRKNI
jgi:hypothetical protein